MDLKFEKGSEKHPTGNLLVYCYVVGENPLGSSGKIIASNVVVSFLKIGDNYPVVTFPPVSLEGEQDLKAVMSENIDRYDVVRIADFELPTTKEEGNQYIQERMEQFNGVVVKYVELCKNREKRKEQYSQEEEPFYDAVEGYLDALANLSMKYRASTGLAREATMLKVDRLVEKFSSDHPQFDLDNFKRALTFPGEAGEELVGLYLKKFNAISSEDYENASLLKKQILELESAN